jgi:DNA repair protein RecO (recombination protein O)
MHQRATGLILRTRLLTETSLIVHWLTAEFGRLATVAKGARGPKSPFRGKLDLFYLADFSFVRSRRSELHLLREVSLRDAHRALRRDLGLLQQTAYCAALIEQTTEMDAALPGAFELLLGLVRHLSATSPQPQTMFAFEMKWLAELGQAPDLSKASLTPGARRILETFVRANWPAVARVKLTALQTAELRQFLHGFLIYHLGKILPGRALVIGA